jgi:uncharacterized glyoxalase superfamily protein PhnB
VTGDPEDELAAIAPEFFVPDVAAAVRFYVDVLGFRLLRADPTFAVVTPGRGIVMLADERLYAEPVSSRGQALDVRFMVDDADALHDRLAQAGVEIVHAIADREYGLRDFIIRDPRGFRLRFAQPLR